MPLYISPNEVDSAILDGTTNVSGGQIAFPAAQSASAGVNTLDDYEEGTYTPVLSGTTTAGTGTYTNQDGRYTKIGGVVNFSCCIQITAHTGTGNFTITTALPFTPINTAGQKFAVGIYTTGIVMTSKCAQAQVTENSTTIPVETYAASTGIVAAVAVQAACIIRISGTFYAA